MTHPVRASPRCLIIESTLPENETSVCYKGVGQAPALIDNLTNSKDADHFLYLTGSISKWSWTQLLLLQELRFSMAQLILRQPFLYLTSSLENLVPLFQVLVNFPQLLIRIASATTSALTKSFHQLLLVSSPRVGDAPARVSRQRCQLAAPHVISQTHLLLVSNFSNYSYAKGD